MNLIKKLNEKREYIFKETLKIHQRLPETRIASSLSPLEIFVSLYYGNLIKFDPKNLYWEERDRFIVSKGHGAISLYPILADFGFFPKEELENVGKNFLGSIPDPIIPGFETVNGSLGHGLGVGCGIALAIKRKNIFSKTVVLCGDGELYEGSMWEAIMFAGHHRLDNLYLIVDYNKTAMLDRCVNIIDLEPLKEKFEAFRWKAFEIKDGHNIEEVYSVLKKSFEDKENKPKVIIAHTIKGKGIKKLEQSHLSHILSLNKKEIEELL